MKKVFVCFLILLVSFVNSYETLRHFSKSLGNTAQHDNLQCEENDSDSEEESPDSKIFSDEYYLSNHTVSYYITELTDLRFRQHNRFLTSDYCKEIFFPPELS